jgi:hypothetical protein
MKGMVEALGDLGEVIHDRTLVLNVVRGLNEKFAHMKVHFKRSKSFPSFDDVRNYLILEEIDSSAPPPPPATALVAACLGPASLLPPSPLPLEAPRFPLMVTTDPQQHPWRGFLWWWSLAVSHQQQWQRQGSGTLAFAVQSVDRTNHNVARLH